MIHNSGSNYSYKINKTYNRVEIQDLTTGTEKTVTNNAENVLTEIRNLEGDKIEKMKIIYQDTDGRWDTIVPVWEDEKCIIVGFQSGIQ